MTRDELNGFCEEGGFDLSESNCRTAHIFSRNGATITSVQKGHVEKLSVAELAQILDTNMVGVHLQAPNTLNVGTAEDLIEDAETPESLDNLFGDRD